jgi:sugar lactone lactonase YvrE
MWIRVSRWLVIGVVFAIQVAGAGLAGEALASNPGENGRIAYGAPVESASHPGVFEPEIFTMNPDGSGVRRLTFDAGEEPWSEYYEHLHLSANVVPAWSPSGDRIAYVHRGDHKASIRLMDPEGRQLGVVMENLYDPGSLSWSPDGQWIAFAAGPLMKVRVDGSDWRALVTEADDGVLFMGGAAWSPDGAWIAFSGALDDFDDPDERGRRIFLTDPQGSSIQPINCGDPIQNAGSPEWSPDGKTLYCSSGSGPDPAHIWMTSMADGSTEQITFTADERGPAAAPDGTTVLYTSGELWSGPRELRSYDVSSGATRQVLSDFPGWELDWQPRQGTFWDDERSVFEADIEWMATEGITRGCNPPTNDKYCPTAHVTRGQMAAFLVRALGLSERLDDPFGDDDDSVFEADIEKLAAAGITKGCNPPDNDRFCPDHKVTREQMAAFLVRALDYTDDGGGDLFIDDDDSIFEGDIDKLGTAGVTKGCNPPVNSQYCPKGYVTRGQMAAFLHRALG